MAETLDFLSLQPATRLVHAGTIRSQHGETSEALYMTQGYVYESAEAAEARFKGDTEGYIYSRFSNPTVAMFEQRMVALEEGAEAAFATATGMAAVTTALMGQLRAGDHIVSAKALFGSCRFVVEEHLPRFGIESTLVEGSDLSQWEAAVRPNTKVFFLETPTNPTLDVYDIPAIAAIAKKYNIALTIDNVFATPLLQSPLGLGADCVVYSATKHIDGQGRCLGGVILGSKEFIKDNVQTIMRQTGPSISPFNAWVLLKGLETLPLRLDKQTSNALSIATYLSKNPKIALTIYPFLSSHPQYTLAKRQMKSGGTVITFEIHGGKEAAFKVANTLRIIKISNNLGDAKSLICHPSTSTHHRFTEEQRVDMGIRPGMLRLSAGIEAVEDLIRDLERALETV
ncbi:hypothetical protein HK097_007605 [Rhizophlyctis rosea]|uniref:O-succinylhomoserine sulfhydrylase n=1 Tax=Rhizophlyctis rosea TaxID=64517 RepID=A0AAD5SJT8_9FUNG|nr:hypothetical protein HK097_007605 [Rhizophlyctis rosea]